MPRVRARALCFCTDVVRAYVLLFVTSPIPHLMMHLAAILNNLSIPMAWLELLENHFDLVAVTSAAIEQGEGSLAFLRHHRVSVLDFMQIGDETSRDICDLSLASPSTNYRFNSLTWWQQWLTISQLNIVLALHANDI